MLRGIRWSKVDHSPKAGRLDKRTYQIRKIGQENVSNQEDWTRERIKSGRLDKSTYQSRKVEKDSLPEREGWKREPTEAGRLDKRTFQSRKTGKQNWLEQEGPENQRETRVGVGWGVREIESGVWGHLLQRSFQCRCCWCRDPHCVPSCCPTTRAGHRSLRWCSPDTWHTANRTSPGRYTHTTKQDISR